MLQKESLNKWTDYWEKNSQRNRMLNNEGMMASKWNRNSEDFGKSVERDRKPGKSRVIIDILEKNGFKIEGAKILDIGCGTGALAVPLAERGAEVAAMDISAGMLKQLEKTASEKKLAVKTHEQSWWSADIDELALRGEFDLVIAARTPAIRDAETLQKMMACSKNSCLYIGFIDKGRDKSHAEISAKILHEEYVRHAVNMLFPFMYLYLSGIYPVLEINQMKRTSEMDAEKAALSAIDALSNGRNFDDEVKNKIFKYFSDHSENGVYTSISEMSEAILLWKSNA